MALQIISSYIEKLHDEPHLHLNRLKQVSENNFQRFIYLSCRLSQKGINRIPFDHLNKVYKLSENNFQLVHKSSIESLKFTVSVAISMVENVIIDSTSCKVM